MQLLKAEYRGRTLYDCGGNNPPHAWAQPSCTAVPPGGLQEKIHLQVRSCHIVIECGKHPAVSTAAEVPGCLLTFDLPAANIV